MTKFKLGMAAAAAAILAFGVAACGNSGTDAGSGDATSVVEGATSAVEGATSAVEGATSAVEGATSAVEGATSSTPASTTP